ncbi:hypothetical protein Tco_0690353, partial [Tanacetum coccineum]
ERVQTSGSVSPASEQQSTDRLESSSSQNSDNCNNSYTPSEPQQQQGSPALPSFSVEIYSPTGFGNFTSPNGYTLNPGVVGSASGLDDSSRLKYKDGNVYVPNPQAETSELWMNPRDMPSMQSASYYNMAGQTPHHAAYLQPSHGGHASFNAAAAAAAQSSHMQFPGMYHPSQPGGIANPHHMAPTMQELHDLKLVGIRNSLS